MPFQLPPPPSTSTQQGAWYPNNADGNVWARTTHAHFCLRRQTNSVSAQVYLPVYYNKPLYHIAQITSGKLSRKVTWQSGPLAASQWPPGLTIGRHNSDNTLILATARAIATSYTCTTHTLQLHTLMKILVMLNAPLHMHHVCISHGVLEGFLAC